MLPDSTTYNPSPEYLRQLIHDIGLSQRACARLLGIGERSMRDYLSLNNRSKPAPYLVQFALEALARSDKT